MFGLQMVTKRDGSPFHRLPEEGLYTYMYANVPDSFSNFTLELLWCAPYLVTLPTALISSLILFLLLVGRSWSSGSPFTGEQYKAVSKLPHPRHFLRLRV